MSTVATMTLQTPWDCRWSRPGYRVPGVPAQFQPETIWVCTRTGDRRCVDASDCEDCWHWESAIPNDH